MGTHKWADIKRKNRTPEQLEKLDAEVAKELAVTELEEGQSEPTSSSTEEHPSR